MPNQTLLMPGNGHQMTNRKKAVQFVVNRFGATQIDVNIIRLLGHTYMVAAATSPDGLMYRAPNGGDHWLDTARQHDGLIVVRQMSDGRIAVYSIETGRLVEACADAARHGRSRLSWPEVEKIRDSVQVFPNPVNK